MANRANHQLARSAVVGAAIVIATVLVGWYVAVHQAIWNGWARGGTGWLVALAAASTTGALAGAVLVRPRLPGWYGLEPPKA